MSVFGGGSVSNSVGSSNFQDACREAGRNKAGEGGAVAAILNPVNGYRDKLKREGKTVKNHVRDNVVNLRKQQSINRMRQEEDEYIQECTDRVLDKLNKHKNVESKINSNRGSVCSTRAGSVAGETMADDEGNDFSGGGAPMSRRGGAASVASSQRNFIQENGVQATRSLPPVAAKAPPAKLSVEKPDYGKTPKYLKLIKNELSYKADQKRKAHEAATSDGLVLMPEEERVETLNILEQKKVQTLSALHRLPIRIETPSAVARQKELESQLREIEDAIIIFSRKQVFISDS